MIVNFRYHVFTITAIFAALGIGILIGSSFIGHEGLLEEQKKIINDIANNLNNLRSENFKLKENNQTLQDELSYREQLEQQLLALAAKNGLIEKKYVLITTGKMNKTVNNKINDYFSQIGIDIQVIKDYENLNDIKRINLILWGQGAKKIKDFITGNENVSFIEQKINTEYNLSTNLFMLMLAILESELNEKREKDFDNNSSL